MAACAPLSYKILAKTQTSALPACIAQLVKKCLNKLVNEYVSSPPHDAFSGFSSENGIFRRKTLSCPHRTRCWIRLKIREGSTLSSSPKGFRQSRPLPAGIALNDAGAERAKPRKRRSFLFTGIRHIPSPICIAAYFVFCTCRFGWNMASVNQIRSASLRRASGASALCAGNSPIFTVPPFPSSGGMKSLAQAPSGLRAFPGLNPRRNSSAPMANRFGRQPALSARILRMTRAPRRSSGGLFSLLDIHFLHRAQCRLLFAACDKSERFIEPDRAHIVLKDPEHDL